MFWGKIKSFKSKVKSLKLGCNIVFSFRGKHWCIEKKYEAFEESEFLFEGQVSKSSAYQVENQLFPGELDRGTPVIIKENDRNTVIGETGVIVMALIENGKSSSER